jgi:hypothetical protein
MNLSSALQKLIDRLLRCISEPVTIWHCIDALQSGGEINVSSGPEDVPDNEMAYQLLNEMVEVVYVRQVIGGDLLESYDIVVFGKSGKIRTFFINNELKGLEQPGPEEINQSHQAEKVLEIIRRCCGFEQ